MTTELERSRWVIKRTEESEEFRSVCGFRRSILVPEDGGAVSLSHLRIHESREHYHKKTEEVYYILKGRGALVLDGEHVPVGPGDVVLIRPGVRHHSEGEIEVLIVCCPPFEDSDCWFDD